MCDKATHLFVMRILLDLLYIYLLVSWHN